MDSQKIEKCADALTAAYVYDKEKAVDSANDIEYNLNTYHKQILKELDQIEKLIDYNCTDSTLTLGAVFVDQHFMAIVDATENYLHSIKEITNFYLENRITFLQAFVDARKKIAEHLKNSQ